MSPSPSTTSSRCFVSLPGGRYGVRPERAVVVPLRRDERIGTASSSSASAAWRAPSEGYLAFLALVASQLTSAIARARASEEERLRAEAMAELDRAKTLFFSNISHELRTPLTLMLGPTTDALRSPARTLERHDLEIVHRNALRLQKLVGSLLDFARIEAGRARASLEPVRLDTFTGGAGPRIRRRRCARPALRTRSSCEPLPRPVLIDPDMWEKILLNLISNALKFTFDGKVRVSMAGRGEEIELEVADTGIGIPAHELPHIFDRFHRVAGRAGAHARRVRHRARAGARALAPAGRRRLGEEHRGRGHDDDRDDSCAPGATLSERGPPLAARAADNRFVEEARRWLPNADATATPPLRVPSPAA